MFISNTEKEKKEMLEKIGVKDIKELLKQIPEKFLNPEYDLPPALNEIETYRKMKELSEKNKKLISFAGGGIYDRYTPAVVKSIISRGEFLTAYTPYQAEVSQGILQTIYEYQSLISNLYDMDFSNASMYDGSTALAEAIKACVRISGKNKIIYSSLINPKYIDVVKTYFTSSEEYEFIPVPHRDGQTDISALSEMIDENTACAVISNPNYTGVIEDIEEFNKKAKEKKVLTVCLSDPLACALLKTPGEAGFDFAVGEGQSLGLPLSYGGPYLGIFTCKKDYLRQMPGRVCGMTVDREGKRAFVLTLQAREQHIRREKAPSNICTNQALCALSVTVYLTLLGKNGLKELASLNHSLTNYAIKKFKDNGFKLKFEKPVFNEFVIELTKNPQEIRKHIIEKYSIDPGIPLLHLGKEFENSLMIAVTETKTENDIDKLVNALKESL